MRLITSYLLVSCNENKTKLTPTLSNWCSIGIAILNWSLTSTSNNSCRHEENEWKRFFHPTTEIRLEWKNPLPLSSLLSPIWASSIKDGPIKGFTLVLLIHWPLYQLSQLLSPSSPCSIPFLPRLQFSSPSPYKSFLLLLGLSKDTFSLFFINNHCMVTDTHLNCY